MTDLHTPRFSGAQAAKACGVPVTTFRTYFARGHFRLFGDAKARDSNGLPNLFSLRDVIGLAVAIRLLQTTPLSASRAFEIGMGHFAHMGSQQRVPGLPFNVHQHGETLLLVYPDTERHRIVQGDQVHTLSDAGLYGDVKAVCVLKLNDVVANVFAALGLDRRDGYIGSPENPYGPCDDEEGELVPE